MSRTDDLIEKFCPEGVRFEPIGSVVQRGSRIRWTDVAGAEFQYIDLTSVNRNTHTIAETQTITSENAPSRAQQVVNEGDVIFGTTRPTLRRYTVIPAEYDGQIASTGYCLLRPKPDRILSSFLFHLLGTGRFYTFIEANERGGGYPAIPDGTVKEFRIPVPPVEVQREIVRVLDLFTSLETELEAELAARKQQFAYSLNALVTFAEDGTAKCATLGELGEFIRGRRFTKDDYVDCGLGCIHYGQIYTDYGTTATQTITFLPEDFKNKLRLARPGDLVIAATGENVEDVCKAVAWLGVDEVAVHDDCFIYRHELNPTYASYLFQSSGFQQQKIRYVSESKVVRISGANMAKIRVQVPPLEDQERIVKVLNNFDALINDLSSGLPAEIAARRKQYEHYRDRLLTFKELAA